MCAHNPHPTRLTIYGAKYSHTTQKPENPKIAKLCSQIAQTISLFTTAYIVRQRVQQVKKSAIPCKHCIKYSFYIIKKMNIKLNPTQHNITQPLHRQSARHSHDMLLRQSKHLKYSGAEWVKCIPTNVIY